MAILVGVAAIVLESALMLTRVQCPCGFVASAQSIRAASYAVEEHAVHAHNTGISIGIVLERVKLLDRTA